MRVLLIDPTHKTIEELHLNEDQVLKELYKAMNCSIVERIVSADRKLQIVVDEEGAFKENDAFLFLPTFSVYTNPYVGKAVVMGYDFTSLPEDITIDYIKANTKFLA